MRDRVIKIPDLCVSNSKSVILRKNISDYTLPEMVQKLERMLDKSPDPQTKEAIEKCIDELE